MFSIAFGRVFFYAFTWVVPFWMARHISPRVLTCKYFPLFTPSVDRENYSFQSIHKSSSARGRLWFTVARRVGYFIFVVMKRNSNSTDNNKTKKISTECFFFVFFQIKSQWQCSRLTVVDIDRKLRNCLGGTFYLLGSILWHPSGEREPKWRQTSTLVRFLAHWPSSSLKNKKNDEFAKFSASSTGFYVRLPHFPVE